MNRWVTCTLSAAACSVGLLALGVTSAYADQPAQKESLLGGTVSSVTKSLNLDGKKDSDHARKSTVDVKLNLRTKAAPKAAQQKASPTKSSPVKSNTMKSSQVKSSPVKSSPVKSSTVRSSTAKSSSTSRATKATSAPTRNTAPLIKVKVRVPSLAKVDVNVGRHQVTAPQKSSTKPKGNTRALKPAVKVKARVDLGSHRSEPKATPTRATTPTKATPTKATLTKATPAKSTEASAPKKATTPAPAKATTKPLTARLNANVGHKRADRAPAARPLVDLDARVDLDLRRLNADVCLTAGILGNAAGCTEAPAAPAVPSPAQPGDSGSTGSTGSTGRAFATPVVDADVDAQVDLNDPSVDLCLNAAVLGNAEDCGQGTGTGSGTGNGTPAPGTPRSDTDNGTDNGSGTNPATPVVDANADVEVDLSDPSVDVCLNVAIFGVAGDCNTESGNGDPGNNTPGTGTGTPGTNPTTPVVDANADVEVDLSDPSVHVCLNAALFGLAGDCGTGEGGTTPIIDLGTDIDVDLGGPEVSVCLRLALLGNAGSCDTGTDPVTDYPGDPGTDNPGTDNPGNPGTNNPGTPRTDGPSTGGPSTDGPSSGGATTDDNGTSTDGAAFVPASTDRGAAPATAQVRLTGSSDGQTGSGLAHTGSPAGTVGLGLAGLALLFAGGLLTRRGRRSTLQG